MAKRATRRYFKNVHRDRERIAAELRKASGERNETERAVDEILARLYSKDRR